jgi:hypothetical protein
MRNNKKLKVTQIGANDNQKLDKIIPTMSGVVLVHHPSCMHCIMLKPKWDIMKKKLNCGGHIMEINADAFSSSNNRLTPFVNGYPTIMGVEPNANPHIFKDERTIENMLKFVTHHLNNENNKLNYTYKENLHGNLKEIKKKKNNKTRKKNTKKNKQK